MLAWYYKIVYNIGMAYIHNNIEDRLANYIDKTDTCWNWIGYKNEHGYGLITTGHGKQVRAHRFLYEMYKGKIAKGLNVLHTCDTPNCVNPDHLFLGTQKDNVDDMISKGRGGYKIFHGESHWASKLNMEKVKQIRDLWDKGGIYQSTLADMFGVSQQVISKVVNYKGWTKSGTTLVTLKDK